MVTTSRADYGHLYWPLRELASNPGVELGLFVLGAHLSPLFGLTVREIERDGFPIRARIECLLSSDIARRRVIAMGEEPCRITKTLSSANQVSDTRYRQFLHSIELVTNDRNKLPKAMHNARGIGGP